MHPTEFRFKRVFRGCNGLIASGPRHTTTTTVLVSVAGPVRGGGRQDLGLLVWSPAGEGVQTRSPKPWAHSFALKGHLLRLLAAWWIYIRNSYFCLRSTCIPLSLGLSGCLGGAMASSLQGLGILLLLQS